MKSKKFLTSAALAITLGLSPAYAQIADPAPAVGEARLALTISDFLKFQENLMTTRAAIQSSPALGVLLSSGGVYTLFAPTNDAYSVITQTQLNRMMSGRASLGHYVVKGSLTTEILREMLRARGGQMTLPTIGGAQLPFTLDGQGNIIVGGVARIGDEQIVGNGVVIPINNVITAPVAVEGTGLGQATGAAISPGVGAALGQFRTYLGQAGTALGAGDLGAFREAYGQAGTALGEAIGAAEGPLREQLVGLREEFGALGGLNEVGALRERFGAFQQEFGGFYQNQIVAGAGAGAATQLLTGRTISDALRLNESLETTRAVVNSTLGLGRLLSRPGTYTLFAPTNDAYSMITQTQLNALVTGQADIEQWVVQGTLTPRVLRQMLLARGGQMSVQTVGGGQLAFTLDRDGNTVIVGGVARLLGAEVYANGVVAPVSNVITAPIAQGTAAGVGGGITGGVAAGGAEVGEARAGVGVTGEVGLEQNVGLFQDYVGRTNEALVGGNFEEAQGYYDRAKGYVESAIGVAEGERLELLTGLRERLYELGRLTDRAALREGFGAYETEVNEFYASEFGE